MSVLMGVSIGSQEVRVVRATSTQGRGRLPDLLLERGTLTVTEAIRVVRLLAGPCAAEEGR